MRNTSADLASLHAVLREVSRSFYLSIRLLPAGLRHPVGLAYLLARATDTVADTASSSAEDRQDLLDRLAEAIATGQADAALPGKLFRFAEGQPHAGESRLLQRVPECLTLLQALPAADATDIRTVLAHIVDGQSLDLERFADPTTTRALPDAAALREYTYLVAGCVGEFWTDLCARHLPDFAQRPTWQMRALGRSFGCGLQLVNIVRDAGEDLRAGRCYFPADELAAAGMAPAAILDNGRAFLPVWQHWQEEADEALADGLLYAQAVNSRRVRAAVALPAIVGRRTVARVREAGESALTHAVKVPRHEVRALLLRVALGLAGSGTLQAQWDNRAR